MIDAKSLLTEEDVLEAETVNYVYCYADKDLGVFGDPFYAEQEPKNVAAGVRAAIIKGSMKKEVAVGMVLYLLGIFHRKTGKLEVYDEPQKVIDLAVFVPKEEVEDGRKA